MKADDLISSITCHIQRDLDRENKIDWEYSLGCVDEALSHHCPNAKATSLFRHQLAFIHAMGYGVIEGVPIPCNFRKVTDSIEQIKLSSKHRRLRNVSSRVGFRVDHIHFGQTGFIEKNWENQARKSGTANFSDASDAYRSLIDSLSKERKTGEWIVYSTPNDQLLLWCLWLHELSDEGLSDVITEYMPNK
jgi:hypothetical protein